jgi:hypothetical protein
LTKKINNKRAAAKKRPIGYILFRVFAEIKKGRAVKPFPFRN